MVLKNYYNTMIPPVPASRPFSLVVSQHRERYRQSKGNESLDLCRTPRGCILAEVGFVSVQRHWRYRERSLPPCNSSDFFSERRCRITQGQTNCMDASFMLCAVAAVLMNEMSSITVACNLTGFAPVMRQ